MQQQSFVKRLIKRRVPQILGLYIAATWMMIEIGDWIVERFSLPPEITSYIFIGMIFFVPSVCYLAYQYGQPGRDPWKRQTLFIVPVNLFVAFGAMFYLVNPVVATETKVLVDETGKQRSFEVAKAGYRKNLISFFWRQKGESNGEEWLQYGLPWLLSKDLDRSLFISSYTPFASFSLFNELKTSGFKNALRVPKSLQLKIARERFEQYVLNGSYQVIDNQYELTVEIFLTATGEKLATHTVRGSDYLALIDELTVAIKETLEIPDTLEERSTDLPIVEHISESLTAIRKRIESSIVVYVDNDFDAAKKLLQEAIAEDFSFATAYASLAFINQLMGNAQEASMALSEALKHEYKFTPQDQFRYRGMSYQLKGDFVSQSKVYEMWVEIEPENVEARESAAQILLVTGINSERALEHLRKLREIKPEDLSVLRQVASLFVLTGRNEKAIESMKEYDAAQPNDVEALTQLAEIYQRSAQFENARKTLEKVLLLEQNNVTAVVNLAKLETKMGEFARAEERLNQQLMMTQDSQQKYQIYNGLLKFYTTRGQMRKCLEITDQVLQHVDHLPPLIKLFQVQFPKGFYLANLGEFDQGLVLMDQVKQQLQPPVNGIVDVGVLNLYMIKEDAEKVSEYLVKIEKYLQQYPNPLFESIVKSTKGDLAEFGGDFKTAEQLHLEALKAVESNIVNAQDEDVALVQKIKLAKSQVKSGNLEQAYSRLQEVINQHPSLAQAYVTLAEYHLKTGELAEAKKAVQSAQGIWEGADPEYYEYKRLLDVQDRITKAE